VRAAWRKWRKARDVRAEDVAIPVETAPGDVAQVDFGYVGKLYDPARGQARKAWVFVMVLAYSRRMVVRICFDQKIETWLRVHVEAFNELGSVPRTLVPDNLKAAVVRAAFGVDGAASLNRSYRELARHFGFKVDPTPIYAPTKKGKVESSVKYVKRNFLRRARRRGCRRRDCGAPALGRRDRERADPRHDAPAPHGPVRRRERGIAAAPCAAL
jgi:transposase